MALPLPVTEQPLEAPFEAPVSANALVLYNESDALLVDVDYYFASPYTVATYSGGEAYGYCSTEEVPAGDPCGLPIASVGAGTFRPVVGSSTILFEWNDVASFFWYYPDGTVVTDHDPEIAGGIDVGAVCAPAEGTVAAVCAAAEGTVSAVCASAEVVVARSPVCTPVEIAVKRR